MAADIRTWAGGWPLQPQSVSQGGRDAFDGFLPSLGRRSTVRGALLFPTGAGAAFTGAKGGRGFLVPASTTAYWEAGSGVHALPGPLTFVCVYELTAVPAGTARVAGTLNGGTSGYGFAPNGTNYRAIVSRGIPATLVGDAITVGRIVVDAFVIIGASGTRTFNYYQDGLLKATTTEAYTPGSLPLRLGADHGSTTGAAGIVYGVALFDLALSGAEIRERFSTPSGVWEAIAGPRRIIVPVSAGGGVPTISALSARLITSTSAQPRISYS